MKIKTDFITNSSSTSFILAFNDEFSSKKIIKAFGIKENSILTEIFEDFLSELEYKELDEKELREYEKEMYKDDLEKINELRKKGKKVYMGYLSSDNSLLESFFCQDAYLIENEEIYFNGMINVW